MEWRSNYLYKDGLTSSPLYLIPAFAETCVAIPLLQQVASDETLSDAFDWLCKSRERAGHNHDVWYLRERWAERKEWIQDQLLAGTYRLQGTRLVRWGDRAIELWGSEDALVLKAIAIVLGKELADVLSPRCFHVAGRGGLPAAVEQVERAVSKNVFVFRSDVKSYYASIDHDRLLELVRTLVHDADVVALLEQYVRHSVNADGHYRDVSRGICLGCSLSPLMGAIYLMPLDEALQDCGLHYARYMDDWVVLAPTRWKLRKAIRVTNQVLQRLRIRQHPNKTFIGRIAAKFSFLGFTFGEAGIVSVAVATMAKFVARCIRFYERNATIARVGEYRRRWLGWVKSALSLTRVAFATDDECEQTERPNQPCLRLGNGRCT